MIRFQTVIFFSLLWCLCCYSQQIEGIDVSKNTSIQTIFSAFENQHQMDFSFDVDAIKDITLKIDQVSINIPFLVKLIDDQTPFILQKIDEYSYILVENNKTIEICGVVLDAVSNFELTQANVLKNRKPFKLTDQQGRFILQVKPNDSISISFLGYNTKIIKASYFFNSNCDTIQLTPHVQTLNQVIINEYLTTGVQKNNDASINVSTKKLRILPGLVEPDVLQSLQLLPGVSSPTEDPAGLYIRGGTPDQNLVLWDGIKMYQTGHFFNQISTFNPYIVKSTKVYRGGTSVRYGDRISGAIIIESDDDLLEDLKVGGGVNFTHADFYAKIPLSKKIGVMGAFRRSTTDIYQNINYNNLAEKVFQNTRADITDHIQETEDNQSREDDFSFSDANFKMVWKPDDNNSVKLSSIFSQNKLDNIFIIEEIEDNNSFSTEDLHKINNAGVGLNWKKKYLNKSVQKVNAYFSYHTTKYGVDRKLISTDQNIIASYNYTQNNDLKDIGFQYALDIPIAKKQSITIGYQYTYNETIYDNVESFIGEFEESISNSTSGHNNDHTIYSEYTYKGEKTYTNFGVRGSYLSRTGQFLMEPRMFSSIELFKNFRVTASAELKNQQINNYSDFGSVSPSIRGLPIADNVWLLSGETIRDDDTFLIPVIKSRQFTMGTLFTYNGWNFDFEAYYKRLNNITSNNNIILEFISISEGINDIEIGKEKRIGFDFLLKKRINNYRFWLGYSLSKTSVTFTELQEQSFPGNFDQRHVFNISQTLKVKDFEFALGWNYSTGRPFTRLIPDEDGFAGNVIDPNGINASRFKAYHRLDASVIYRFNFDTKRPWGGMLGISLRNIYNRKNTIDQGYIEVGTEEIVIDTFEKKSLQLTPDVVIRFNF